MGIDWTGLKEYERRVREYFPCCPICGSSKIEVHLTQLGRDSLSCKECEAKWHLYILTDLDWAELEAEADDGRGRELLGKRMSKKEWLDMAREARRTHAGTKTASAGETVKEREIIREKEVVVKIWCPHCRHTYDETLDKCPHCGAGR